MVLAESIHDADEGADAALALRIPLEVLIERDASASRTRVPDVRCPTPTRRCR
jgi:hypothetical protein